MKKSKKESIIEGATALFSEFGIKRVTVEEICEQADTSKGTFYKYFANKTELVLHIVTTTSKASSKHFKRMMDEGHSFEELVKEILIMKLEFMERFSPHFLRDLYEGEIPELQQSLLRIQDASLSNAQRLYDIGINQGIIDKAVTFDYFLYLLNQVQQTYTDEQIIVIYPDQRKRLEVMFNQFFFGIMGRDRSSNAK